MTEAVNVDNLTYIFPETETPSLLNIDLSVPWNTRTLVIGCNGAGKSTLLKLLSGKHLCLNGKVKVSGTDPFSPMAMGQNTDECQLTTYLGTEWCHMEIIHRDIGVMELLESIGLKYYQERGNLLCSILEVDLNWRMHKLSDGQKRRVQLVMGLLKPWRVLLLDEVTVDLDVVGRSRLLDFLKIETSTRRCSVIYATHIFDGLAQWPNKIVHLRQGRIVSDINYDRDVEFQNRVDAQDGNGTVIKDHDGKIIISKVSSLHPLALHWLNNDLDQH